jgi:hypothetical protein
MFSHRHKTILPRITVLFAGLLSNLGLVNSAHAQSPILLYGVVDIGFAYQRIKTGADTAIFANPKKTFISSA